MPAQAAIQAMAAHALDSRLRGHDTPGNAERRCDLNQGLPSLCGYAAKVREPQPPVRARRPRGRGSLLFTGSFLPSLRPGSGTKVT
jgi:hypothetical protein